ncbi:hypothetical protein [Profundibacter amoris]|jgi:hypothetical protein|nr:hypothetical protein [Profundibacter amoris]
MSNGFKAVLALVLFSTIAACAQQEEEVVMDPVVVEQPTTKY